VTIEFIGWGENAEVVLFDDIGKAARFWMANIRVTSDGLVDAEDAYQSLKDLAPKPIIHGRYAHLHPLASGKDEQS
jgi:hypothetical protein